MRKIIIFLTTICLIAAVFAGCGSGSSANLTITKTDGNIETISAKELADMKENDAVAFDRGNYTDAIVSGKGKITKIEEGSSGFYYVDVGSYENGVHTTYEYYTVTVSNKIDILVLSENLPNCSVGDKVEFDLKFHDIGFLGNVQLYEKNNTNPIRVVL